MRQNKGEKKMKQKTRDERRLDLAVWLAGQIKEVVGNLEFDLPGHGPMVASESLRHNLGAVFGEVEGFDPFFFDQD
jgi:hypothetical protein